MSKKRSTNEVIRSVLQGFRSDKISTLLIVVLLSTLVLTACSARKQSTDMSSGIEETTLADTSTQTVAEPQINLEPIKTEEIASQSGEGLGIKLSELEAGTRLELDTGTAVSDVNVLQLESPSRLVLDLPQGANRLNRIFEVENNPYISRVRLGAHSDKSRVVLDLTQTEGVSYKTETEGNKVYVTLVDTQNLMAAPPVAPEVQVASNEEEIVDVAIEEQEDDALAVVSTEETPEEEAVVAAQNEEPALPELTPTLHAVRIDTAGANGNSVVAEMESAGFFSLQKTAPSEYVLRLEGASHDPQQFSTVLAPPQSGAIRSVRAVQDGDDTLLRIFAKPGTSLVAAARGNTIVVQPEMVMARNDIRAQSAEFTINEQAEGDTAIDDVSVEEVGELDDLGSLLDDTAKYTGRKISLDLQDTDIDNALRIIAEVSNLNIIASDDVTGKVTLRLIDVPWDQALDVILKTNGLDKVLEGNVMRIAPIEKLRQEREALKQAREAEEELEAQVVKYIRVSYAKASELRALVETVLTERGTVTYDERTNQLIVKDIKRGVRNVAELVSRLDLRTPQVLLETQIVEAQRSFFREFGSELGFNFVQSPETGNPAGSNFPNSIEFGGSVSPAAAPGVGVSFPGSGGIEAGSAISLLLDSADGTKSLDIRLSALERDGRVRIVSRPSVVTTNNQQATIKSVEKIRVKTPSGGLSVATGSGASAAGSGGIATETIEIGITLEVTPQASPDYFVLLDINAKSSSFGSQEVDGIPSEVERSATSSVLVSSGQTFAMGGIYKITDQDSIEGVPFLKDVPFFGHFFRRSGVDNADEELIFFITPRIVEGSFDDAAMKLSS